ncbi:hypothetical protein PIB30_030734 [Stylosanthes scabra]|uniref:Uncharacterized protein n=1 Tax=Stylosanthes scabra TaxID=79078 RepID=A0ABU6VD01_9FABA|nr:hypothetical protein [Stylosanthes scabra]
MFDAGNPPGSSWERQVSQEELDQLNRSTKKVRKEGEGFSGKQSLVPREEEWMMDQNMEETEISETKSFAQMVKEGNRGNHMEDDDFSEEESEEKGDEDNYEDEDTEEEDEDMEEENGFPKGIKVEKTEAGIFNILISEKLEKKIQKNGEEPL